MIEGEKTNYFCIIKYGQVSLRKKFVKKDINSDSILDQHYPFFKKLKKTFEMEIKTKENNGYFGAYEVFNKLPSMFTVVSKTRVSVIMLAQNELF